MLPVDSLHVPVCCSVHGYVSFAFLLSPLEFSFIYSYIFFQLGDRSFYAFMLHFSGLGAYLDDFSHIGSHKRFIAHFCGRIIVFRFLLKDDTVKFSL